MRGILAFVALLYSLEAVRAGNVVSPSIGQWNCATWQFSPEQQYAGERWLLDHWREMEIPSDGNAASSTDTRTVIEEVKKECRGHPSDKIMGAADRAYKRVGSERK